MDLRLCDGTGTRCGVNTALHIARALATKAASAAAGADPDEPPLICGTNFDLELIQYACNHRASSPQDQPSHPFFLRPYSLQKRTCVLMHPAESFNEPLRRVGLLSTSSRIADNAQGVIRFTPPPLYWHKPPTFKPLS